jgi:hypothetical protein
MAKYEFGRSSWSREVRGEIPPQMERICGVGEREKTLFIQLT